MAFTTPRTWVTSEVVTASQLNTHLRDNLDFLYSPPSCHAYRPADVALVTSSWGLLNFGAEVYDTSSMHSTGTNPSRLIAPVDGRYLVVFNVRFESNTTGVRALMLRRNAAGSDSGGNNIGTIHADAPNNVFNMQHVRIVTMGADDYVEGFAWQDTGGNLDIMSGQDNTYMQLHYVGN